MSNRWTTLKLAGTAICLGLVVVAAPASAAIRPVDASGQSVPPQGGAVAVPPSRTLTVPLSCAEGARPVLHVAGGVTAPSGVRGRCTRTRTAQFHLTAAAMARLGATQARATVSAPGVDPFRLTLTAAHGARLSSTPAVWNDVTLNCYPPSGMLGGGLASKSIDVAIGWHLTAPGTYWAGHRVLFEEYWNGSGPYWSTLERAYTTNSPFYGSYRLTQDGVIEWTQMLPNFDGTYTPVHSKWTREVTYPLHSGPLMIRAWVGQQIYNGGWGDTVWHVAQALSGTADNYCSI